MWTILLRTVTGIVLALSIAALLLGLKLSNQRKEIKERTQRLELGVVEIAASIEETAGSNITEKTMSTVKLQPEQLKRLTMIDPKTGKPTSGSNTLDGILKDVRGKTAIELSRLNDTRDTLKQTQDSLAQTQQKLKETETSLADANKKIKEQDDTIAARDKSIKEQKDSIDQLTEEKDRLAQSIEEQKEQVTKLQEEKLDLETSIEAGKRRIGELEKENENLKRGPNATDLASGLQGQILATNPEWNFVIIDLPPKSKLIANVDLIVQRETNLVGKVHVLEVKPENGFAIADILPEWKQTHIQIAPGDYVFY